jgi:hypothetical protein
MSIPEVTSSAEVAGPVKAGYIRDYVSGTIVRATPEELDAVQVFARRLVEDYGYVAEQIQTHPQFRVRKAPSDERSHIRSTSPYSPPRSVLKINSTWWSSAKRRLGEPA